MNYIQNTDNKTLKTHHFLIILSLFTIICDLAVICGHCFCMAQILYNGVLSYIFSQLCIHQHHTGHLKLAS